MEKSNTEYTIDAYNKNANTYAEKFDDYPTYKDKIIDFKDKHIQDESTILDLGSGPGNNIKTLFDLNDTYSFTGVDLSSSLLNIAKERLPHCTFIQEDLRSLVLPAKFDVVIASFCIVHLSNIETAELITNISTLLVPGGHLYLSFMEGQKSGLESTSFSKDPIFFNYYDIEFIVKKLKSNKLNAIEVTKEGYPEQDGSITNDVFIYAKKMIQNRTLKNGIGEVFK